MIQYQPGNDLEFLKSLILDGLRTNREDWKAAFDYYNANSDRPLSMNCTPCYFKVRMHINHTIKVLESAGS